MSSAPSARRDEIGPEVVQGGRGSNPVTEAPPSTGHAVLRVEHLAMRYGGGEPVVEDASLEVLEGELVSLLGPSGSGKSTILRAISGLHAPAGGRIECAVGPHEARTRPWRRQSIGSNAWA